MNFKTLALTGLMAVSGLSFAPSAEANTLSRHARLIKTLQAAGVGVYHNPAICDKRNSYGWYTVQNSHRGRHMVICQENKIKGSSNQVRWTAEDFDTIRHEAHHVVQDCMDGRANMELHGVYKNLGAIARAHLSERQVRGIIEGYKDGGNHIVRMEIEAFAVAAADNTEEQIRDIKKYCM